MSAVQLSVSAIRVLIVDAETLFRTGLARLLGDSSLMQVVGLARDGSEAIRQARETRPDVVVLDTNLPDADGLQIVRQLVAERPAVRVLILTSSEVKSNVLAAMQAGATGYVLKRADMEQVASAIAAVAAGESVLFGSIADLVLGTITGRNQRVDQPDGLTPRETEVLKLVAEGVPYKQIAMRLKIGHKTVRNYVCRIYVKLSVYDRSQVTLYAVRKGWVVP